MKLNSVLLTLFTSVSLMLPHAGAQQNAELVRRDQAEILRKANRLNDLMNRLLDRYEKEGRTEQAELLRQGLKHLEVSTILGDAAKVHNSLTEGRFADALRQQTEIVAELEDLLDILLNRQSVKNLEKEIEVTDDMLATASELLRQQDELQKQTQQTGEGQATPEEKELAKQLSTLIRSQRREARENQRQAGQRMPALEAAMARLEELLRQQTDLEGKAEARLAGREDTTLRQEIFRLGNLEQRQRDLNEQRRRARDLQRLRESVKELQSASESGLMDLVDRESARLEARLQATAASASEELARRLRELATQLAELRKATPSKARDEALDKASQAIDDLAREAGSQIEQSKTRDQDRLASEVEQVTKQYRDQNSKEPGETRFAGAQSLEMAAEDMQKAKQADARGDQEQAMAVASQALRRLAEARRALRHANPEAEELATAMASTADQTARDLRNSPAAADEENAAADALDLAQKSLRKLAEEIKTDTAGDRQLQAGPTQKTLENSRSKLEQARDELRSALDDNQANRSQPLSRATERQKQLAVDAQTASEALKTAGESGQLGELQKSRTQENLDEAKQAMQNAEKSLEQGHQSQASAHQEQAADSLEKAKQSLQRNRMLSEEGKQQLKQLAQEQDELRKQIIELAELAKERNNRQAEDALQEAAKAADQARRELSDDDPVEAEQRQEQVKQKIEEAQEALEEERDRYMDLRQEELLFRIKDELQQFLEKQQPITVATSEAGQKLANGRRLTRVARRRLQQLGEQELELADKTKFIKNALREEDIIVYAHVLKANEQDLRSISQRLSRTRPDPGEYTRLLQHDVENRTTRLIAALKREQKRREDEKQKQKQPGQNKFDNQRQRLVPIVAELKMLKELEEEMLQRTNTMDRLMTTATDDDITDQELAMAERLANQHNALTEIFSKVKAQLEEALSQSTEEPADKGKENK